MRDKCRAVGATVHHSGTPQQGKQQKSTRAPLDGFARSRMETDHMNLDIFISAFRPHPFVPGPFSQHCIVCSQSLELHVDAWGSVSASRGRA